MKDRPFSYRALFAVVYTASVSSVYFALGVVAHHANGLTPVVFLIAGLFFGLAAMTYAEGASMHPERGGSAVFARYAFNELVSFVAGWAIFLDYTILIAVTALTVPAYLAAFYAPDRQRGDRDRRGARGDRARGRRQPHRRQRPPDPDAASDHDRRPDPASTDHRARLRRWCSIHTR